MTFLDATNLDYLKLNYSEYTYDTLLQEILKLSNTSKFFAEQEYTKVMKLSTGNYNTTPFIDEDSPLLGESSEVMSNEQERLLSFANEMLKDDSIPNIIKLAFLVYLVSVDSNRFYKKYRKYIIVPDSVLTTNGEPVNKIINDLLDNQDQILLGYYKELEEKYPALTTLGRKTEYFFTQTSTSNIKNWLYSKDKALDGKSEEIIQLILKLRKSVRTIPGITVKSCMELLGFGENGKYSELRTYRNKLDQAILILNSRIPESYYGFGVE